MSGIDSKVYTWLYADFDIQCLGVLLDELTVMFTSKHQALSERDGRSTVTLVGSGIAGIRHGWNETCQFSVPQIEYPLGGSSKKGSQVYFLLIVTMVLSYIAC